MKRVVWLFPLVLMLIVTTFSCKEKDERDIFTGIWTGHLIFERIGDEYNTTEVITKSTTDPSQIIVTEQGSFSSPRIATVSGTRYTYQVFSSTLGITGNYNGSGNISGNVITESGTISSDSDPYPGYLGNWYKTLTRQ